MFIKPLLPTRLMFIYALIPIGVILLALVWFAFHYVFWVIQPVSVGIAESLGTNGTQYTQVDTFFQSFDNWALIIALIALFIGVIVLAQRRGQQA